jgi:hypothetical protein
MLERTAERFGLKPERLAGDGAYGSAEMPHWLAWEKIVLHVPAIDKFARQDGTSSRAEFRYDPAADTYICIRAHKRATDPQKDREHEPKQLSTSLSLTLVLSQSSGT